jgi:hypothetical protein
MDTGSIKKRKELQLRSSFFVSERRLSISSEKENQHLPGLQLVVRLA